MSYFGIDLHLKTREICEISEEGEVITRTELQTNRERLRQYFSKRASSSIAFEACAQSFERVRRWGRLERPRSIRYEECFAAMATGS